MQTADHIDPNAFVTNARQVELIEMAEAGNPASAIRHAIRDAVQGATDPTGHIPALLEALKTRILMEVLDQPKSLTMEMIAKAFGFGTDEATIDNATRAVIQAHVDSIRATTSGNA